MVAVSLKKQMINEEERDDVFVKEGVLNGGKGGETGRGRAIGSRIVNRLIRTVLGGCTHDLEDTQCGLKALRADGFCMALDVTAVDYATAQTTRPLPPGIEPGWSGGFRTGSSGTWPTRSALASVAGWTWRRGCS